MDDLEVPDSLASSGVESQQAVCEEIHAVAFPSVKIWFCSLGGNVDNPSLFIERLAAPGHGSGGSFPGVRGPGVITELPGAGDEVEDPPAFAGSHVVGANSPHAANPSHDNQVPVDDSRGVKPGSQVDGPVLAKFPDGFSGVRVHGKQVSLDPGQESSLFALFIFPVNQPTLSLPSAPGLLLAGIPFPDGLTRRCVKGHDLTGSGGGVENSPDDQVVGLVLSLLAGVVTPGRLEGMHIPAVDLSQRGIQVTLLATKVDRPVMGSGLSGRQTCPGQGRKDCDGSGEMGLHGGENRENQDKMRN